MNFNDVLHDIEKLIGLRLEAINPSTGYVEIISVNSDAKNLQVKLNGKNSQSRPFSQLEKIWSILSKERTVNIESALEGSGSSRHIPETIFANLPYIEFFKYKNKKHLFLNSDSDRQLGTIKEIGALNLKKVKSSLDNLNKFDRFSFTDKFNQVVKHLEEAVEELKIKFPGEFQTTKIYEIENNLHLLSSELAATVLPSTDYIPIISSDTDEISFDTPGMIGYEGGSDIEIDGDEKVDFQLDSNQMLSSRIRTVPITISLLYDRIRHNEIELQPDYQRKDRIWPSKNKSALIESVLLGLPIPTFYFAERASGNYVIVDGLQRITTFYDYIADDFELTELKVRSELNGSLFSQLPRPEQRKIRECQLHTYVISIQGDNDVWVRELFQRINTYGVKMSYQEIRCALYPGSSVKFIKFLAESEIFKEATFNKVQPKRMRDMELILGAISFILFGYRDFNEKKFDDFLVRGMTVLNGLTFNLPERHEALDRGSLIAAISQHSSSLYIQLTTRIVRSFELAIQVFGNDRFKKEIDGRVINKALFELITSTFALLSTEQHFKLLNKRDVFKRNFYRLISGEQKPNINWESDNFEDRDFEYAITQSTGKRVTIIYRFSSFKSLLEEVLEEEIFLEGIWKNDK